MSTILALFDLLGHIILNRRKSCIKLNPDLVALLNKTINKDEEFKSRNEFFERSVLRYLEEKGTL